MRLQRFETAEGRIVPVRLDEDGTVRDLSAHIPDIDAATLDRETLAQLARLDAAALPEFSTDAACLAPPMAQPRNIWCVGLNYSDHAEEAGMPIPEEPILFNKAACTYCSAEGPIYYAPHMQKLDWEVELGIVIGTTALGVKPAQAMEHVAGYVLVNDVSERSWQIDRCGQWAKGKSYPNFCPTGPWLTTVDVLGKAENLPMWLDVNGERRQTGTTAKMIFDVPTIVSAISEFTRLEAGDLICTGTPPGVGMGMTPPLYLKQGDTVTLGIEGLGQQCQEVVSI